jgi:hypothetical protein
MNKNRNHNYRHHNMAMDIPPAVQRGLDQIKRDLILENDPIYAGNIRQLRQDTVSGRVPLERSRNCDRWLAMSSLRRNHVPMSEAKRLMRA